ncbi:hypothetical protein HB662_02170 [Roseomonas frigidaquae]|uniref:Uncharacterized protein n=1 Tax=Falsiroseomonas frigidaquae TaxID=487318 RepID=A0ABX1EVZ7_9PROT|nr:hypothetical protein [Falsiroseomonas frigidaquae]NKE43565.1 hypothetical protein [Falsiroseomonas frigidaquae]
MADGISIREFARREGCNDKLVRRAVDQGKLKALPNGKLDPALVGTGWRHANRHVEPAADKGADIVSAVSAPADRLEPQPQGGALRRRRRPERDEDDEQVDLDDFSRRFLSGDIPDLATSEKVKAAAGAMRATLAAQQLGGALVELELAEAVLFDSARAARDAWLNFPAKVGALLAADLGLEADRVVQALTPYVQQQLEDLGEPEADFTPREQG